MREFVGALSFGGGIHFQAGQVIDHLRGIRPLLLLVQLRVDGKNHVSIGVSHPALQRFERHLRVVRSCAELHAEIVAADVDFLPRRQLALRQELLLLVGFAVPALVDAASSPRR